MSKDGGTAFPIGLYDGITKRDYFAAKAMQGFCSKPFPPDKPFAEWCSQMSYEIADEMLKEREK